MSDYLEKLDKEGKVKSDLFFLVALLFFISFTFFVFYYAIPFLLHVTGVQAGS